MRSLRLGKLGYKSHTWHGEVYSRAGCQSRPVWTKPWCLHMRALSWDIDNDRCPTPNRCVGTVEQLFSSSDHDTVSREIHRREVASLRNEGTPPPKH